MVTDRQAGVGLGAASVGLIGAEAIEQAAERRVITNRQATAAAGLVSAGGIGLGAAGAMGAIPLGPDATAGAVGAGVGAGAWFAARRIGIAPRIVVRLPREVNLASTVVSAGVISAVALAGATVLGQDVRLPGLS